MELSEGTYTLDPAKVMTLVAMGEDVEARLKSEVAKLQDATAPLRSTWQTAAAGQAWDRETVNLNSLIDHLSNVVQAQAATLADTTTKSNQLDNAIAASMGGVGRLG